MSKVNIFDMHDIIRRMRLDKESFKNIYTEGEELINVKNSLNNRIITLRKLLLEQPDNQSLNFELEFCLAEVERLEEKFEDFQKKYGSKDSQINMHKEVIEYDLRELNTYIGFLKQLEVDKELVDAITESVESIEEEISMLDFLENK